MNLQPLTPEAIQARDGAQMLGRVMRLPEQVREARAIGEGLALQRPRATIENIVVAGMGGSAISGDLLRSALGAELPVPMLTQRYYRLPGFVNPHSLIILSSYSGDTEETLSCYDDAIARRAPVLCICSGGELAHRANKDGHPCIAIPGGLPPRAALGYLTIPVLVALAKLGLIADPATELDETIALLEIQCQALGPTVDEEKNRAKHLARKLHGKIPIIYASIENEAVALRWKGQFSENAKTLAFANCFPELNHNEIVGWEGMKELQRQFQVIFLRDRDDHPRIQKRMEITQELLKRETNPVVEIPSEGSSRWARLFSLIAMGDFTSVYLAVLNGVDPTPIEKIQWLKKRLREV